MIVLFHMVTSEVTRYVRRNRNVYEENVNDDNSAIGVESTDGGLLHLRGKAKKGKKFHRRRYYHWTKRCSSAYGVAKQRQRKEIKVSNKSCGQQTCLGSPSESVVSVCMQTDDNQIVHEVKSVSTQTEACQSSKVSKESQTEGNSEIHDDNHEMNQDKEGEVDLTLDLSHEDNDNESLTLDLGHEDNDESLTLDLGHEDNDNESLTLDLGHSDDEDSDFSPAPSPKTEGNVELSIVAAQEDDTDTNLSLVLDSEDDDTPDLSLKLAHHNDDENNEFSLALSLRSDDEDLPPMSLALAMDDSGIEVGQLNAEELATQDHVIAGLTFTVVNGALHVIGRGAYGNVYQGSFYDQDVAVKVRSISKGATSTEGDLMCSFSEHPNIVSVFTTYAVGDLYEGIIMERAAATIGDVIGHMVHNLDQRRPLSDPTYSVYLASCVIMAIEHMHSWQVVHLDIKPHNVLITTAGMPKIADFSSSVTFEPGQDLERYPVGTEGYQAPEIITESGYSANADWFSCGTLLYYMSAGSPPWGTCQLKELNMVEKEQLKPLISRQVQDAGLQLLTERLLSVNPEDRMDSETRDILNEYFPGVRSGNCLLLPPECTTVEYAQTHVFS